ncbi:MAG: hypothetical protein WDA27_07795 [Actinomycetota bacterium]
MEPRQTSHQPIKVYESTKEQVRLMAAVSSLNQAEIVESAVNEYLERHAEEFALGLKRAREALFRGKHDAIAYLLDENVDDVRRVAGSAPAEPR